MDQSDTTQTSAETSDTLDGAIDAIVNLGQHKWRTHAGHEVQQRLWKLIEREGTELTRLQVERLVLRGESYSRAGIDAVGAFYDAHFVRAAFMHLDEFFVTKNKRVAYFCAFCGANGGPPSLAVRAELRSFRYAGLTFADPRDRYMNTFMNRGSSALLDYVVEVRDETPEVASSAT